MTLSTLTSGATPTITSFQPASQQLTNPAAPANGLVATGLDHPALRAIDSNSLQGIPIYSNMVERLANTVSHPDPDIAYMLAVCSAYSYSNIDTLAEMMSLLGFAENKCEIFNRVVDAMLVDSTAFLVRSHDRRVVILSYRGTSPLNFNHWLTDIDVEAEKMGSPSFPGGRVHAGFYRNARATQRIVIDALRREPFSALYITGHSLGAAMAALMAVTLKSNVEYQDIAGKIRAVYAFAQPMVGDSDFVEACQSDNFLRNNVFRFIYRNDIIPHVPPTASGGYQHFGRECRYQVSRLPAETQLGLSFPFMYRPPRLWSRTTRWRDTSKHPARQVLGIYDVANAFFEFFARKLTLAQLFPFRYSIEDHLPRHYIHAVSEATSVQTSEFGQ